MVNPSSLEIDREGVPVPAYDDVAGDERLKRTDELPLWKQGPACRPYGGDLIGGDRLLDSLSDGSHASQYCFLSGRRILPHVLEHRQPALDRLIDDGVDVITSHPRASLPLPPIEQAVANKLREVRVTARDLQDPLYRVR